ncbi:sortase family protein [Gottschalkia acidurici 9a]|uniref:Sortase family protein n=1 Tax=Gottschalkia acidurici (strain ATCC 7906 / DSM 604 / BCRC 14475 / CIP 104303 / KCTC 5404 / NCIMB 10678 / 9a) TaxID=1128398 RepID=K0AXA8_GOTA9|nr:class D sortase [Gottschalkia acidurici]AFS77375.1 sortase family protein [Gottschalkia acidurici 9a]
MKRRLISTIFIIVGLSIIAYPKSMEIRNDYKQQRLKSEWSKSLSLIDSGDIEEVQEQGSKKEDNKEYSNRNMDGILRIRKINLELPILKGATPKNLNSTVASVNDTTKVGEVGNYSIAGHRSHTYGRNFNRLDELKKGDSIEVETEREKYIFIVSEKLYVEPEEVSVLEGNNKDKEITLITCHPMINPTHRLIVKGKIVD